MFSRNHIRTVLNLHSFKIQSVPLYQLDRSRLAQLAKSVRHIDASNAPSESFFHDYNPNIPGLLLDVCEPGTFLFPSLESLTTRCRNDAELLGTLPLLSSSLRSLEVSVHHSAIDFMMEFLAGIEERATKLEQLEISCQPRSIKAPVDAPNAEAPTQREFDSYLYIPPIASALCTTLRTLSIPGSCMSTDTLLALAHLPLLKTLSFSGPWSSEAHGDEWPELEPPSFPALEHVVLQCPIPSATHLLAAIPDSAPIRQVETTSPSSPVAQDVSELCAALSRFRSSLRHVSLKQSHINEDPALSWSTAFSPLLECDKLEALDLGLVVELSDTDAEVLVSRLPRIKSLRLPSGVLSSVGLRHVASLGGLRELEVSTSAFEEHVVLNSLESKHGPSEGATAELHLSVGASPIHSPASVTYTIRRLIPHRTIDLEWTSLAGDIHRDALWGQVRDSLLQ
jgi:hypothetical protein